MITTIEEVSMNAWPALQTVLYDGWVIRLAAGYSRRANSINPIYPSRLALAAKIRFCEDLYQAEHLPTVFKLTPAVYPADLDDQLAASGYRHEAGTSVQTVELAAIEAVVSPRVTECETLSEEWLEAYCRMNAVAEARQPALRRILLNIVPQHCFMLLKLAGQPAACGLAVRQSEHVGLFDIVTDPAVRRQGYGRQIVSSLLAWGRQQGAERAYLQVMHDNAPAVRLYAGIGFVENYRYWYRVKP